MKKEFDIELKILSQEFLFGELYLMVKLNVIERMLISLKVYVKLKNKILKID